MKISDIINTVNGNLLNNSNINNKINKIKIDSRKVNKNDLFICIKGLNNDGHKYISDVKNIASAIIVSEDIDYSSINIPIIKVNDTIEALGLLAFYIRNMYDIPLIAITGSVGKTTTKELISHILSSKYKVLKTVGNYNNHIGLPLTLLNLNKSYDIIVTEIGMNHLGEISKLSKIANPNTCIITNIGTSHIGNLGSKENIFKAKMEIVKGMNKGDLIVNANDEYLDNLSSSNNYNVIKCGFDESNDLYAHDINCDTNKSIFKIKFNNNIYQVVFNIPGKHLITNVLIAIKCCLNYGIDIKTIIDKIDSFKSINNRMEIINISNNNILISDTYNSSYESLTGALNVIKMYKQNKIIILGDILEIGNYKDEIYNKIDKKLQGIDNKKVYLVGNDIININNDYNFNNVEELLKHIKNINIKDSVILIKGSNKINLKLISDYLKNEY